MSSSQPHLQIPFECEWIKRVQVYIWQNRVRKEEAVKLGVGFLLYKLNVETDKVYKASIHCCFCVLILQALALCYDGAC
ncbi:hypothetical protein L2E82_01106 [Cichorium intybus]|uniref:Uncharacterized protein n=1 Tax=Cichorium intybus TaxID=13427 RepID=A0ACB9GY23_CICIN|nr:hypothetical protein L2E82_01106 [Cichorium intybus]